MSTAMMMFYDIPEEADIPNPSAEFRQFAFRINLSCWVIQEGDLSRAAHTLDSIRRVGGDWHTLPIADSGSEEVIGLAAKYISSEVSETLARANVSAGRIMHRLNAADDREAAIRVFRSRMGQIGKRCNLLLRDMRYLATRWGISYSQVGLVSSLSTVATLQAAMMRRAAEYVRVTNELAKNPVHAPMANAAKKGQVPAGILADYADESGIDGSGLR